MGIYPRLATRFSFLKGHSSLIMGIDEAGRGPVLGPLVICGILVRKSKLGQLLGMGIKDSKLLSSSRRQILKQKIEILVEDVGMVIVTPSQIDICNIYDLEIKVTANLINRFVPDQVFIDALTSRPLLHERKIRPLLFPEIKPELIIEIGADKNYPIVGAASILAKVERDRRIHVLEKKYGTLGSGYPSDPRTVSFLKNYFEVYGDFPNIVRKRWRTIHRLKEENLLRKRS